MMRRTLLATTAMLALAAPAHAAAPALAAYVGEPNIDSASQQASTASAWNQLSSQLGHTPTMSLTYADYTHPLSQWAGDAQWLVQSWQANPALKGVEPVYGIPMAVQGDNADADFQAIASGQWDSTLNQMFQTWASAGYKNFIIRPGWEMNGGWYPWAVTPQNANDFNAAFQHIAALAHSFTGASIQVAWTPAAGNYSASVVSYYPGNAAVDQLGIDIYGQPIASDTGPTDQSTGPTDFTLTTAIAMAKADAKPLALGEVGGVDASFPQSLASVVSASGVPVSFVAIWDSDGGGVWSGNPATEAAWRAAYDEIAGAPGAQITSALAPPLATALNNLGASQGDINAAESALKALGPAFSDVQAATGYQTPAYNDAQAALGDATAAPGYATPAQQNAPSAPCGGSQGMFGILNGVIYTPQQTVFMPHGINLNDSDLGSIGQVLAAFPKINFIRVPVFSYKSPSTYAAAVKQATAAGVVLEFEDHQSSDGQNRGGATGAPLAGQQLSNELSWYSAMAAYYAGNPYVWYGTDNEPAGSPEAVAQGEQAVYNAVRSGSGSAVILLELPGGGPRSGMPASYFANMTNTVWDPHFYGWVVNYSTDSGVISAALNNEIAAAQSVPGAGGATMPVIIGEFGNSTNGATMDPNGKQVVAAVLQNGKHGFGAWNWAPYPVDNLTTGGGALSAYGQQVQAGIAGAPGGGSVSGATSCLTVAAGNTSPPSTSVEASSTDQAASSTPTATQQQGDPVSAAQSSSAAQITTAQQELQAADQEIQQAEAANAAGQPPQTPAQTAALLAQAAADLQAAQTAMAGVTQ